MQQFLTDLDHIVDLSPSETKLIIESFRRFLQRNLDTQPHVLNNIFSYPAQQFLNQQEDEDNLHAQLTEIYQ